MEGLKETKVLPIMDLRGLNIIGFFMYMQKPCLRPIVIPADELGSRRIVTVNFVHSPRRKPSDEDK